MCLFSCRDGCESARCSGSRQAPLGLNHERGVLCRGVGNPSPCTAFFRCGRTTILRPKSRHCVPIFARAARLFEALDGRDLTVALIGGSLLQATRGSPVSVDIDVFGYNHAQRTAIGRLALVDEPVQNMHGVGQRTIDQLVDLGVAVQTGEHRRGCPTYRLTDFGGQVHEVLRRANRIPR
jgi:hypothetical protein